jgi:hypothetical protein
MGQVNTPTDVLTRLKKVENELQVIRKEVGLNSATISGGTLTVQKNGAFRMISPDGSDLLWIGPRGDPHADGSPQQITEIFDESGQARIVVWDPSSPSSRTAQQIYMYDDTGHLVFTTDVNGGQAVPWFNVPLYPFFIPCGQTPSANGEWNDYDAISTGAVGMAAGNIMWEGRIPYVTHPMISIDGIWGNAGGSVSNVAYALVVGGTTVGTWTRSTVVNEAEGPWDISSLLGQTQVPVQLLINGWTGSGQIACQPLGCYLRQT